MQESSKIAAYLQAHGLATSDPLSVTDIGEFVKLIHFQTGVPTAVAATATEDLARLGIAAEAYVLGFCDGSKTGSDNQAQPPAVNVDTPPGRALFTPAQVDDGAEAATALLEAAAESNNAEHKQLQMPTANLAPKETSEPVLSEVSNSNTSQEVFTMSHDVPVPAPAPVPAAGANTKSRK